MKRTRLAVGSCGAVLLSIAGLTDSRCATADELDNAVDIHIPAQHLADALIALARQTGLQIMMAADELDALQSAGAEGHMTPRAALATLLSGTPLHYREVGERSIAIQRSEGTAQKSQHAGESVPPGSDADRARLRTPASASITGADTSVTARDPNVAAARLAAPAADQPLQEIIVTAQKIAVDVMHAPVSMTAINGDTLRRDEIKAIEDLQFYVPGLTVSNTPNSIAVNIRGIGLTFNSPNIAQGVPVYRDGLLVPTSIGDEPLWDVANVQVLRGPQGTLVGANSTGGAIYVNTANPDVGGGLHGYARLMGGDYRHVEAESAVNLPITDTFAARAGIRYERRDSFSDNLTPVTSSIAGGNQDLTSQPQPGGLNMTALRGSLLWRPNEQVQVLGKIEYFQNQGGYAAEKPIAIMSTEIDNVKTICPAPGSYRGSDPATWNEVPAACGFAPFAPGAPYQLGYATNDNRLDEQIWRESVEGRFVLTGSGLMLRLLAGGSYNTIQVQGENTASAYYNGGNSSTNHEHSLTYEADLLSPDSGALRWVTGAFFWRDPTDFIYSQVNFSGGPYGSGPGFSQPTGGLYLNGSNSKESYAAFANATYAFSPRWKLEAGARETRDRNSNPFRACQALSNTPSCVDGDSNAFHFLSPNPVDPWGPLVFNGDGFANLGSEQDSLFTWKSALDYNLSPQNFLYAVVATGAKSGGIRTNVPGDNFAPERDTDFELGWKITQRDGRFSIQLDGFYTKYSDMQIRAIDTNSGQGSIFNAGFANVYGVEFAGQAALGAWQFAATASYTKSSFSIGHIVNQDICNLYAPCSTGRPVQCPPGVPSGPYNSGYCFNFQTGGLYVDGKFYPWLENVNALQLPNSPTFQGNLSIGYRWALGAEQTLSPRLDLSFQGVQYGQIYNTPLDHYRQRTNLNFKLAYGYQRWLVEGYATNLGRQVYSVAQNDQNTQMFNAPLQFGVRATRQF